MEGSNRSRCALPLLHAREVVVVLLTIETLRVESEIRTEHVGDADQVFPHIYGPLPRDGVIQAHRIPLGRDGQLVVQPLLEIG
jgi:uncharacterized protein (DUF952 family)